jgi:hypothetical protein
MQFTHLSVKEFLFQNEEDLYTRDHWITSCLVDKRDAHTAISITRRKLPHLICQLHAHNTSAHVKTNLPILSQDSESGL